MEPPNVRAGVVVGNAETNQDTGPLFPIRAWYKPRAPLEFPSDTPAKGTALTVTAERCLSGRKSTPGKCVYVNSVPGVRIPLSPPPQCCRARSDSCEQPVHVRCLERGCWIRRKYRFPVSRIPPRDFAVPWISGRRFPFRLSPESPVLKVVTPGIALDTHRFDLK